MQTANRYSYKESIQIIFWPYAIITALWYKFI